MYLSIFFSSFSIYAIVLLVCFTSSTSGIGRNETDRLALLGFKAKITDDPFGVMSSWNETIHFCQWHGVTCGRRHQRVTVLDLQSLKLVGSISPHIGNLSFLSVLYLPNNNFNHQIPPEIGRLHRLKLLELKNNSISGKIPSNMSSCSNLVVVSLAMNQLVGEIPAELGSLKKLQAISVYKNKLTGSIPLSLGNLSSLVELSLSENDLGGNIPDTIGKLTNLIDLYLGLNRLSGTIPSSFLNLSSITDFDIGSNYIEGNIPSELGISLPNLQLFSIGGNQFTGSIPDSISNASNLQHLQLVLNKLSGKVPSLEKLYGLQWLSITSNYLGSGGVDDLSFLSSLTNATSLKLLGINKNNFGGVLPKQISNFSTELKILLLDANQISGSIPTGIGNLVKLQDFEGGQNQLSGIIPFNIGKLKDLERLIFNDNKFSGFIPSSLGNLTKLIELRLPRNNLQGSIPSSLGNCQKLQLFDLNENNLSGAIPPKVIGGLLSLSIYLGLYQNHLTGALPNEVGKLKNLREFDVSENMLSGKIPSSLGSCVSLELLYMEGNFFHGPIPSSLSSLRGLELLDFSRNNLSGEIPEFLENFKFLQTLNLSYNDLEGIVPTKGVFTNASAASVKGNNRLCGGIPEFHLATCNFKKSKKRRLNITLKLIFTIVSGLLGVSLVLSFLFLFWFRKIRKETTSSTSENSLLKVSYQSLLKATDGFSSTHLIGIGSFGSVYKGILEEGGTVIAVKVLNLLRHGASKSFIAECEALRNIRHRNLVKVLTACSGIDYSGNDFKALVYEFMVNGSLEDWLRPTFGIENADEAPKNLNLLRRLNIAIDVACALEYLHHHCETPIVHCDLKPSNILLDADMTGHVGDFGLVKFVLEGANSSRNQSSSVGVRGTIGYAPPEYGLGSEVSTYGDVYSYGILLLEMFTGKKPTDDMFKEGLNLHNFTKAALPEGVAEIADPILLREISEGETSRNSSSVRIDKILGCLISIFGIGISCSSELPGQRMYISDVASELCSVREKLLGSRLHQERRTMSTLHSTGVHG